MAETSSPVALYDEAASLQALQRYGILDTPMEPAYDDLAGIAAHVCEAPVALISLLARVECLGGHRHRNRWSDLGDCHAATGSAVGSWSASTG